VVADTENVGGISISLEVADSTEGQVNAIEQRLSELIKPREIPVYLKAFGLKAIEDKLTALEKRASSTAGGNAATKQEDLDARISRAFDTGISKFTSALSGFKLQIEPESIASIGQAINEAISSSTIIDARGAQKGGPIGFRSAADRREDPRAQARAIASDTTVRYWNAQTYADGIARGQRRASGTGGTEQQRGRAEPARGRPRGEEHELVSGTRESIRRWITEEKTKAGIGAKESATPQVIAAVDKKVSDLRQMAQRSVSPAIRSQLFGAGGPFDVYSGQREAGFVGIGARRPAGFGAPAAAIPKAEPEPRKIPCPDCGQLVSPRGLAAHKRQSPLHKPQAEPTPTVPPTPVATPTGAVPAPTAPGQWKGRSDAEIKAAQAAAASQMRERDEVTTGFMLGADRRGRKTGRPRQKAIRWGSYDPYTGELDRTLGGTAFWAPTPETETARLRGGGSIQARLALASRHQRLESATRKALARQLHPELDAELANLEYELPPETVRRVAGTGKEYKGTKQARTEMPAALRGGGEVGRIFRRIREQITTGEIGPAYRLLTPEAVAPMVPGKAPLEKKTEALRAMRLPISGPGSELLQSLLGPAYGDLIKKLSPTIREGPLAQQGLYRVNTKEMARRALVQQLGLESADELTSGKSPILRSMWEALEGEMPALTKRTQRLPTEGMAVWQRGPSFARREMPVPISLYGKGGEQIGTAMYRRDRMRATSRRAQNEQAARAANRYQLRMKMLREGGRLGRLYLSGRRFDQPDLRVADLAYVEKTRQRVAEGKDLSWSDEAISKAANMLSLYNLGPVDQRKRPEDKLLPEVSVSDISDFLTGRNIRPGETEEQFGKRGGYKPGLLDIMRDKRGRNFGVASEDRRRVAPMAGLLIRAIRGQVRITSQYRAEGEARRQGVAERKIFAPVVPWIRRQGLGIPAAEADLSAIEQHPLAFKLQRAREAVELKRTLERNTQAATYVTDPLTGKKRLRRYSPTGADLDADTPGRGVSLEIPMLMEPSFISRRGISIPKRLARGNRRGHRIGAPIGRPLTSEERSKSLAELEADRDALIAQIAQPLPENELRSLPGGKERQRTVAAEILIARRAHARERLKRAESQGDVLGQAYAERDLNLASGQLPAALAGTYAPTYRDIRKEPEATPVGPPAPPIVVPGAAAMAAAGGPPPAVPTTPAAPTPSGGVIHVIVDSGQIMATITNIDKIKVAARAEKAEVKAKTATVPKGKAEEEPLKIGARSSLRRMPTVGEAAAKLAIPFNQRVQQKYEKFTATTTGVGGSYYQPVGGVAAERITPLGGGPEERVLRRMALQETLKPLGLTPADTVADTWGVKAAELKRRKPDLTSAQVRQRIQKQVNKRLVKPGIIGPDEDLDEFMDNVMAVAGLGPPPRAGRAPAQLTQSKILKKYGLNIEEPVTNVGAVKELGTATAARFAGAQARIAQRQQDVLGFPMRALSTGVLVGVSRLLGPFESIKARQSQAAKAFSEYQTLQKSYATEQLEFRAGMHARRQLRSTLGAAITAGTVTPEQAATDLKTFSEPLRETAVGLRDLGKRTNEAYKSYDKLDKAVIRSTDNVQHFAASFVGGMAGGFIGAIAGMLTQPLIQAVSMTVEKVGGPIADKLVGYAVTRERTIGTLAAATAQQGGLGAQAFAAQYLNVPTAATGPLAGQAVAQAETISAAKQFESYRDLYRTVKGMPQGLAGFSPALTSTQGPLGNPLLADYKSIVELIGSEFQSQGTPIPGGMAPTARTKITQNPENAAWAEQINALIAYGAKTPKGGTAPYRLAEAPTGESKAETTARQQALAAAGLRSVSDAGYAVVDAFGNVVTDANKLAEAANYVSKSFTRINPEEYINLNRPQWRAQIEGAALQNQFQIKTAIPVQRFMDYITNPPLKPGTGILPGINAAANQEFPAMGYNAAKGMVRMDPSVIGSYDSLTNSIKKSQDALSGLAEKGRAALAALNVPPGTIAQIEALGKEIAAKQERIGGIQANLSWTQYLHDSTIAKRTVTDMLQLTGQLGKANGDNVGYYERQLLLLNRQSTALGLMLQQRQITTQQAIAGFAVEGDTPEIRMARRKEAMVEADIAQKQLNISKKSFGIEIKLVDAQNLRQLQDAVYALQSLERTFRAGIKVGLLQQDIENAQRFRDSLIPEAAAWISFREGYETTMISIAQDLAARMDAAVADVLGNKIKPAIYDLLSVLPGGSNYGKGRGTNRSSEATPTATPINIHGTATTPYNIHGTTSAVTNLPTNVGTASITTITHSEKIEIHPEYNISTPSLDEKQVRELINGVIREINTILALVGLRPVSR
jgi:hypothetical protein